MNKPKPNKGKGKAKAPPQRSDQQVEEAGDDDVEMLGNLAQGSEAEFDAVTSPSKKVARGTGDAALRKQCDEVRLSFPKAEQLLTLSYSLRNVSNAFVTLFFYSLLTHKRD